MRSIIAITALVASVSAIAQTQVPNVFEDGTPALAAEVNENFQYVLENASGGCSATQEGSNVRINCADGTEGLLASGGTIVVLPESSTGEVPDITINSGKIVVMDANDVVIARPYGTQYFQGSYVVNFFPNGGTRLGVIYNNDEAQTVTVGCYSCSTYVYYRSENCTGIPFQGEPRGYVSRLPDGKLYVAPQEGGVSGVFLFGSRLNPNLDECLSGEWSATAAMMVEFIPAPEILNAAYPVRLEQLP